MGAGGGRDGLAHGAARTWQADRATLSSFASRTSDGSSTSISMSPSHAEPSAGEAGDTSPPAWGAFSSGGAAVRRRADLRLASSSCFTSIRHASTRADATSAQVHGRMGAQAARDIVVSTTHARAGGGGSCRAARVTHRCTTAPTVMRHEVRSTP